MVGVRGIFELLHEKLINKRKFHEFYAISLKKRAGNLLDC